MSQRERADFFLSRRGSVATVAQEVADVLTERGYSVIVQDYDIAITANFVEAMHEAVKNSRDLVVLFTHDYEASPHTRKEFTNFEADRAHSPEERRIVILRCEDVPLRGLFAASVYQDLVGVDDPEERRRRIIAAAEGASQAVKPMPRPFAGVPPRLESFTGRGQDLDRLDEILIGGKPAAVTQSSGRTQTRRAAVQGLGGVGKTSLATEYAHRYRDLYAGVWWAPAETRAGLVTSLAALAVELGVAQAADADLGAAAKAALRRLAEQRATWLLVYDNVTAPDEIADLLPASGARVLITSRFADWGGWAEEVALDVLRPDEAVALLQGRSGRNDEPGARALAEALGHLPLALDHAAAFCRRTNTGFLDYAAKAGSLIAMAPRGAAYPRSVGATFDLALEEALAQSPAVAPVMAYLAACAPERIPAPLADGAADEEGERLAAMLALTELSLVRHDPFDDGAPALTVHRLVQAVARKRLAGDGARHQLAGKLTALYPDDGYGNPASWEACARLLPHLVGLFGSDHASPPPGASDLLVRAGDYLHARGRYAQALPLFERALSVAESTFGPDHAETAAALGPLALLLRHQGDLARAEPLYERALAISEKTIGPDDPRTGTIVNNLAMLRYQKGDRKGSLPFFRRALDVYERGLGSDHPAVLTVLNNLGTVLARMDDLDGAKPFLTRALEIRERTLGPDHPDTAMSLHGLASLLVDIGDATAGLPLAERALAINERVLGPDHPGTATSLNDTALIHQKLGDLPAARALFERSLAISERTLGADHPDLAATYNNLGILLQQEGDREAAERQHEAALAMRERKFGAEHPTVAESLNNIGMLKRLSGDQAGARALLERSLAIREKTLGASHSDTADTLSNLALSLQSSGDVAAARQLHDRARAIIEKTFGPDHRLTAECLANLASWHVAAGNPAEALDHQRRALAIFERRLGADHADTRKARTVLEGYG